MSSVESEVIARRDRSPSFPSFGLEKAVERTRQMFEKAKRHEVRVADVAADWGLGVKSSSTLQTVSSLLAFGLIEPGARAGTDRKIKLSDAGWRIVDDQRAGVKERLLGESALKPKLIAEYYVKWMAGRPDDAHAVSQLKFDSGLGDDAAWKFLRVFDDTIRFVIPGTVENVIASAELENIVKDAGPAKQELATVVDGGPRRSGKGTLMEGERELTTGLLSKGASFRLIVSGTIGEKEIERLIKKLELDKEILAEQDEDEDETLDPLS